MGKLVKFHKFERIHITYGRAHDQQIYDQHIRGGRVVNLATVFVSQCQPTGEDNYNNYLIDVISGVSEDTSISCTCRLSVTKIHQITKIFITKICHVRA